MRRGNTARLVAVMAVALSACGGGGGTAESPRDAGSASRVSGSGPATVSPSTPSAPAGVEGSIDVGLAPADVVVAFGSVWVSLHHAASVVRVDPSTHEVIATIPVHEQPGGMGVGADAVWVMNYGDNSLTRIEPGTNDATTFPLSVQEACYAPLVTPHLLLVHDCGGQVLVGVDPGTGRTIGPLPDDVQATCGRRRGGAIALVGNGQLVRVDARTGRVLDRKPGATVMCTDTKGVRGDQVWAGSGDDPTAVTGTVSVVSLETGDVEQTVEVGRGPDTFAADDAVWVRELNAHQVQRIDPASFQVTATIPYPDEVDSGEFAVGFGAAWLADFANDRLVRVALPD
ncbi:MAG: hypothetical protein ACJ77A_18615 [Actinomycetota bacterium]